MSKIPIFVIGSNSFSGASFIRYSLDAGHDVIGMSRSEQAHEALLPYSWSAHHAEHFQFEKIDMNHDLDRLFELIHKHKPEYIVNFAAQSMVGQSWDHPEDWMHTNVVSATSLFKRLRECDFLKRYVHVTTPEVYGSTDGFITEDTPFNPTTPYAVSRAAGDMSLLAYVKAYNIPAVMTRAANVFGPGQQLYRIIPRTIIAAMTGQQLTLDGGGISERSFIHMDDVSDATWKIMEGGTNGECYHISTTRIVTIRELVEIILERMGADFASCVTVGEERLGKDSAYLLDSSKIIDQLGWRDTISLEQGIDECIAWARKFESSIAQLPIAYQHKK